MSLLQFNPNAGKDGSPSDAFDIHINIDGRDYKRRLYDVTRVFDNKGNELQPTDPEYNKIYSDNMNQILAVISHVCRAVGVTKQMQDNAFQQPVSSFAEWCQRMVALANQVNYQSKDIDIFLEWQWNISPGADRKFLEIPKNMKGGSFICPSHPVVKKWTAETSWIDSNGRDIKGLRYKDDGGNIHPFVRNAAYMNSNKAKEKDENVIDTNTILNQINNSVSPNKIDW